MNQKANHGEFWVCLACGKISRWKYGFNDKNSWTDVDGLRYASDGWDESCMLNSKLFSVDRIVWNYDVFPVRVKRIKDIE